MYSILNLCNIALSYLFCTFHGSTALICTFVLMIRLDIPVSLTGLTFKSCLEVIKLEYILRLKIKRNDWLPCGHVSASSQSLRSFELENELKFYNLEA